MTEIVRSSAAETRFTQARLGGIRPLIEKKAALPSLNR